MTPYECFKAGLITAIATMLALYGVRELWLGHTVRGLCAGLGAGFFYGLVIYGITQTYGQRS